MSNDLFELKRDISRDMLDYLPHYYALHDNDDKPGIAGNLIRQETNEIIGFNHLILDVLRQFFIEHASWGLARWENLCGIPVDESKPYDQRRSVIKSKLRGAGTVTLEVIKNVADSFENGEIKVEEIFSKYQVVITFIDTRGKPANEPDMRTALREIIPAHLELAFHYTYLIWDELDAADLTWDELEALNMTWDELEIWKPNKRKERRD
ncbi:putative phage tail protein [Fontibacillus sp. BL9]|uniref:putative phage tail protein n=1 Tax=Fontibacillus sp. BL9 TaxID=3389971 RepID=UPI00397DDFE5